jgi:hypothetical protein
MSVEAAMQDLESRTLAEMSGSIAQLIYIASTRDYNTGQYNHDGLTFCFTEEVARTALAAHHRKIFRELVFAPLEDIVQQLDRYMGTSGVLRADFLELWKKIQPYRVTVPADSDPIAMELFASNVKVALAILQTRQETVPHN